MVFDDTLPQYYQSKSISNVKTVGPVDQSTEDQQSTQQTSPIHIQTLGPVLVAVIPHELNDVTHRREK